MIAELMPLPEGPTPGERAAVHLQARKIGEEAIHLRESDPERALDLVRRGELDAEAAGSRIGRAWRLQIEGWQAIGHDDIAGARPRFDEAIEIAEAEAEPYCLVKSLNGLAAVFSNLDLFDRSLHVYRRALAIARSIDDHPELAAVIGSNIGVVLQEIGDPAGAANYLEEALALGTSNPNNLAGISGILGLCYADLGRPGEAEILFKKSLALCVEGGFTVTEAITRTKYAKFLLELGRSGEAIRELTLAIRGHREVGSRQGESEALVAQARALAARGRHASARRDLRKAARLAGEVDAKIFKATAIGALAELDAKAGRWKRAYALLTLKGRIENEVFRDKVSSQALALKSERAEAEAEGLRGMNRRLAALSEIGRAIASATDVDGVCRILHERIAALMPAEVFGVALYLPETDQLDYRYFVDAGEERPLGPTKVDPETTLSGWCLRHGREVVLGDVAAEHGAYTRARTRAREGDDERREIRSLIYCPVLVKDKPVAVMTVQSRDYRQYEPYHVETLKALGAYVGVALENARLFESLRELAITDPLTRCLNRRRFLELMDAEVGRAIRYGTPISLIIFDLDHFKLVNDRFGHPAGDLALTATVETARKVLRATDILARYGGEEFAVALPGTGLAGATALAERLRADLEAAVIPVGGGREIRLTASFGVAERTTEYELSAIFDRADGALYRAKEGGRNRVVADRGS